jgi:hypothetical protein
VQRNARVKLPQRKHPRLPQEICFYDHALRKAESLRRVAGYNWDNPVRAGVVEDPLAYPWSSSQAWPDWKTVYGAKP